MKKINSINIGKYALIYAAATVPSVYTTPTHKRAQEVVERAIVIRICEINWDLSAIAEYLHCLTIIERIRANNFHTNDEYAHRMRFFQSHDLSLTFISNVSEADLRSV